MLGSRILSARFRRFDECVTSDRFVTFDKSVTFVIFDMFVRFDRVDRVAGTRQKPAGLPLSRLLWKVLLFIVPRLNDDRLP